MDLKSTYNLIAEDWDRDHLQDDWWIAGTNTFMSFLRPGVHILDAGCAGGIKAEALRLSLEELKNHENLDVYAKSIIDKGLLDVL